MLHTIETDKNVLCHLTQVTTIADTVYRLQGFNTAGSGPYPADMTREEFIAAAEKDPALKRPDTVVRRHPDGTLYAEHYTAAYAESFQHMSTQLAKAAAHTPDTPFRTYLESAAVCMRTASPDAYRTMIRHWLAARNCPVQLVLVWNETYSDTQLGLKGSMDAGVFTADDALTNVVQRPLDTWTKLMNTLQFPGNAFNFTGFYTRVYNTVALGGALPEMKLRAWNLPDDPDIRRTMGSHQLILKENTLTTLENDLIPMIRDRFRLATDVTDRNLFFNGLLWTLTAHELGHNVACYIEQTRLLEMNDTFEELKANILPLIWVMNQHAEGLMNDAEVEAAIAVYLALDLMDCVLAETVPGRRSYARATWIQMNQLEKLGAITIRDERIQINLAAMETANRKILDDVLLFMSQGHYSAAEMYAKTYGTPMNIGLI